MTHEIWRSGDTMNGKLDRPKRWRIGSELSESEPNDMNEL